MMKYKNKAKVEKWIVIILGVGLLVSLAFNKIQYEMNKQSEVFFNMQYQELEDGYVGEISQMYSELNDREYEIERLNYQQNKLIEDLTDSRLIDMGVFEITNYTLDSKECGKEPSDPYYGITASGKTAQKGVTIASDWSVLPNGTRVLIEGIGVREVQDSGNLVKDKVIDVYIGDPEVDKNVVQKAISFGRQERRVWIIDEKNK